MLDRMDLFLKYIATLVPKWKKSSEWFVASASLKSSVVSLNFNWSVVDLTPNN